MDSSDEDTLIILTNLRNKGKKRKKRFMWCPEYFLLRNESREFRTTFCSLMTRKDETFFFNYLRMSYTTYEELRDLMLPHLQPIGCNWREPISPEEKLLLALRHLATGGSFASTSVPFHMSEDTTGRHVLKDCKVLWDVLQPLELQLPTEEQWGNIAKRFCDLWDYPFAIGSLNGKDIALKKPGNSGSMFYNYKGFPSIVLMALSDADSCFILVDCGQYGRISDDDLYLSSQMSTLLEEGNLNIPPKTFTISGSDNEVPYLVVGDGAFPLKTYLMKPFCFVLQERLMQRKKGSYNYRHSRARRAVECAFGILASKFEIFQRPMRVEPVKAVIITNAATGLHKFIRCRDGHVIDRSSSIAYEIRDNAGRDGLLPLVRTGRRATEDAMKVRDALCEFFSDPNGSVGWQNNLGFRNV